jgi:hypothetical protein
MKTDRASTAANATAVATPESERRRSKRMPQVVEAWLASPTAADPKDREEVMSVNLSRHGIAFEHHHELPIGTFHMIDVAIGTQQLRTEVRIRNCRKREQDRYEIGAEFC